MNDTKNTIVDLSNLSNEELKALIANARKERSNRKGDRRIERLSHILDKGQEVAISFTPKVEGLSGSTVSVNFKTFRVPTLQSNTDKKIRLIVEIENAAYEAFLESIRQEKAKIDAAKAKGKGKGGNAKK